MNRSISPLSKSVNPSLQCRSAGVCNRIVTRLLRGSIRRGQSINAMFSIGALIDDGNVNAVWRELFLSLFSNSTAVVSFGSSEKLLKLYQDWCNDNTLLWPIMQTAVDLVCTSQKSGFLQLLALYLVAVHNGSVPIQIWDTPLDGNKLYTDLIERPDKEAERHMLAYLGTKIPQCAEEYSWDIERFVLVCVMQLCLRGYLNVMWKLLSTLSTNVQSFLYLNPVVNLHRAMHDLVMGKTSGFRSFEGWDRSRYVLLSTVVLFTRASLCRGLVTEVPIGRLSARDSKYVEVSSLDVGRWQAMFTDHVKEIPDWARLLPREVRKLRVNEGKNITQNRLNLTEPLKDFLWGFSPFVPHESPWYKMISESEMSYFPPVLKGAMTLYMTGNKHFCITVIAKEFVHLDEFPRRPAANLSLSAPLLSSLNAPSAHDVREFTNEERKKLRQTRGCSEEWMMGFIHLTFSETPSDPANIITQIPSREYTCLFEHGTTTELIRTGSIPPLPVGFTLNSVCLVRRMDMSTSAAYFEAVSAVKRTLKIDTWSVLNMYEMRHRPAILLVTHPAIDSDDGSLVGIDSLVQLVEQEPVKFLQAMLFRVACGRNRNLSHKSFCIDLPLTAGTVNESGNEHRSVLMRDDSVTVRNSMDAIMRQDEQDAVLTLLVGDGHRIVQELIEKWKPILESMSGEESLRSSRSGILTSSNGNKRSRISVGTLNTPLYQPDNLTPSVVATLLSYINRYEAMITNRDKWYDVITEWFTFFCA